MAKKLYINLPVADLEKATSFYEAVGFVIYPAFSDKTATCLALTEEIGVMLLSYPKYLELTNKEVVATSGTASVYHTLSVDSKEEVDDILEKALKAGGTEYNEPEDFGFMKSRNFIDLDGNIWVIFYMDMNNLPKQ